MTTFDSLHPRGHILNSGGFSKKMNSAPEGVLDAVPAEQDDPSFDQWGLDQQGYDRDGRDRTGIDKNGDYKGDWDRSGFRLDGLHHLTGTPYSVAGVSRDGRSIDPDSLAPAGTGPVAAVRHLLNVRKVFGAADIDADDLDDLARVYVRSRDRPSLLALRQVLKNEWGTSKGTSDHLNPGQNTWYADEDRQREWISASHRTGQLSGAWDRVNERVDDWYR